MADEAPNDFAARLGRLEDQSAITDLILSYGPAADAGQAAIAGNLWAEDGFYDWDAAGEPYRGNSAVEAMLQSQQHRGLMAEGVAHFAGPPLIQLDGDRATAVNYSLIMRRQEDRYYLWRVSAVRWELRRQAGRWLVAGRTNRLLDASGAGSALFGEALRDRFDGARS